MDHPTLNDAEARILGVLIEKAFTTPGQYPLSLNGLLSGCNQKSNRDPVTNFVEAEIVVGLQGLVPKHLAGKVSESGSRVDKYKHSAKERLGVGDGELAILAELLMRGPQAQGELRSRVHRMVETPSLDDLRARLDTLIERGLVERVAPLPGSRATRFAQCLSPGLHAAEPAPSAAVPTPPPSAAPDETRAATPTGTSLESRVDALEREVRELRNTLATLIGEPS